jgi:hypothetical protein
MVINSTNIKKNEQSPLILTVWFFFYFYFYEVILNIYVWIPSKKVILSDFSFTPPHVYVCLKPWMLMSYVVVILCSMVWGER